MLLYPAHSNAQVVGTPTEFVVSSRPILERDPRIVITGSRAIAMWTADPSGTRVEVDWATSMDAGQTWTIGAKLPRRDPVRHAVEGFPSLCVDNAGTVHAAVAYLGDGFQQTLGLYRAAAAGAPLVWSGPIYAVPLGRETVVSPIYDAPDLRNNPVTGTLYLTFTRVHYTGTRTESTIQLVRSTDAGTTWSVPISLSSTESNGGRTAIGPEGELYVVWNDMLRGEILGRMSTDDGINFDEPFVCGSIAENRGSGPPGYQPNYGRVYDTAFPAVDVDRTAGPHRGRVYVTWAERATGTVQPTSGGFAQIEPNEHFVTATPVSIGSQVFGATSSSDVETFEDDPDVYRFEGEAGTILWIEGQVTGTSPFSFGLQSVGYELLCGQDTLSAPPLASGTLGDYRADSTTIALFYEPTIVTLPRTGTYYIRTLTAGGKFSISYQFSLATLAPEASSVARDSRDIVLVSSGDRGMTWGGKTRVNDEPPLYDNALASLAVDPFGQVHVAWYGRLEDPDCGFKADVYWAALGAGGISGPARRLSSLSSAWRYTGSDSNIGDALAVVAGADALYFMWTDFRGVSTDIYGARVPWDVSTETRGSSLHVEWTGEGARLTGRFGERERADPFVSCRPFRAAGDETVFEPLVEEPLALSGPSMVFEDSGADRRMSYRYKLELTRASGAVDWLEAAALQATVASPGFSWSRLTPNPTRGRTEASLWSPVAGRAFVGVYDVRGSRTATLLDGPIAMGATTIVWDGRVDGGASAAPGIYFLRAEAGALVTTTKFLRLNDRAP